MNLTFLFAHFHFDFALPLPLSLHLFFSLLASCLFAVLCRVPLVLRFRAIFCVSWQVIAAIQFAHFAYVQCGLIVVLILPLTVVVVVVAGNRKLAYNPAQFEVNLNGNCCS